MTTTLYSEPERHGYLDRKIRDLHHDRIIGHLVELFGLEPGDRVAEIGAGSGRYTEMLLDHGLRVVAIEPDRVLADKLEERLGGTGAVKLAVAMAGERSAYPDDVRLVCGFHILHHLDRPSLEELGALLRELDEGDDGFRGWFFLEPNPMNPLYPVQISLTPGMRFSEEKGIWRRGWQRDLAPDRDSVAMGTIGLFPPREVLLRLPRRLLRAGTRLLKRRSVMRLYSVYGVRSPAGRSS